MRNYSPTYEEAVKSYMTLQLLHSEFSYLLYEENLISFFISALIGPILSKLLV